MKLIELEIQHEWMLLEMCNNLFDDNNNFTQFRLLKNIETKKIFKNEKFNVNFIQYINQESGKVSSFHWYEFVMNYLSQKVILQPIGFYKNQPVYARDNKERYEAFLLKTNLFNDNKWIHPVVYLYDIFKNNQNAKT